MNEETRPILLEPKKILLLDDDPIFRSVIICLAKARRLDIEAYESPQEIESFTNLGSFCGALIDYHLRDRSAIEMLGGLEAFFASMPTLIVSIDEDIKTLVGIHSGFCGFISKGLGGPGILDALERLIDTGNSSHRTRESCLATDLNLNDL